MRGLDWGVHTPSHLSSFSSQFSCMVSEFVVVHSIISKQYVDGEVRSNSSEADIVKYNTRAIRMHIIA